MPALNRERTKENRRTETPDLAETFGTGLDIKIECVTEEVDILDV